jgi:rare lipoprotein A
LKSSGLVFERALGWVVVCWFCLAGFSATVQAVGAPIKANEISDSSGWLILDEVRAAQETARNKQSPEQQAERKEAGVEAQNEPAKAKPEPEHGYAAFYRQSLEGHKTACGGTYSSMQLTAAHPKLPCGTKLRVTNLRNGKAVRVTVTDHGPSRGGKDGERIIDVSYAAAQALGFVKQGTTLVKVEVVR